MDINRVAFTPAEAGWFSRSVVKAKQVLEAKAKTDPSVLERKTYKILTKMQAEAERVGQIVEAFTETEQYEVDVNLTRKQKLVLEGIVNQVHQGLSQGAIPKYEKDPEQYKEYLEREIEKARMLNSLARKLK